MEQYLAGARPVDIFRQAGFDVSVLEKQSAEFAVKVDLLAEHGSLDEDYVLNKSHGNAYLYELIYEAMGKYAGRLSVNSLCDIFHVSRQGYYRYLKQRSLLET